MKMTHKLESDYEENGCKAHIKGVPYLLMNLEIFTGLNNYRSSHADFIYIEKSDDNNYKIYIVELTNTTDPENLIEELKEFKNHKYTTIYNAIIERGRFEKLKELVSTLNININNYNIYGILVLPEEAINSLYTAIFSRQRLQSCIGSLMKFYNKKKAWLSKSCNDSITYENNKFTI